MAYRQAVEGFERLHRVDEFKGARSVLRGSMRRAAARGRVWADGEVWYGARYFFTV